MENNKNEIDLLELLIKIYLSLKRYWLVLLISVLAGIVFTIVKNIYFDKSYNSSMSVSVKPENDYMYALTFQKFSNRYEKNPAEIVTGIINQANKLIKSDNISLLAKKMNLSKSDLIGLKSISSEYNFETGEAPGSIIQIQANSSDSKIFKKLGNGILYLINNNSFVKEKTSEDSLMLVRIIKKIDIKLSELDSLQSKFLKDGKITDLIIFKDNSFFGESVKLTSLKEKINKDLKNLKEVELVDNFYIPKTKYASIKMPLLLNSIMFLFLGIIIIVFIEFNKKAKSFEQNQKN
ncbi:MAG: hypothetical protein L3J56_03100 [Bacteroidales bacterium]|nr:hypothetical protein [Bacteroidales bacterium]